MTLNLFVPAVLQTVQLSAFPTQVKHLALHYWHSAFPVSK
jgi:hypothetical protein